MFDAVMGLPFGLAYTALFLIVLARSSATYALGRGAISRWDRRRQVPEGPGRERAESLIRSLGPIAVTLSYLTVGIQTTIHLTAGALRMPLRLYLPAAILGSLAWAGIYATVGLAVIQAWVAAMAGSWYGIAAIAALVLVGIATWFVAHTRTQRRAPVDVAVAPDATVDHR